jgi:hypothetical protein
MWYLGDRYTERYYVYLDPTIWREYSTEDGNNISIVGASTDVPLARQIEDDSIDYVVLSERSGQFERVDRLPNAERIQTFSAYNTGRRTHLVAIWKVKNGSEQNINGTNSNFIVSETRKKQN